MLEALAASARAWFESSGPLHIAVAVRVPNDILRGRMFPLRGLVLFLHYQFVYGCAELRWEIRQYNGESVRRS